MSEMMSDSEVVGVCQAIDRDLKILVQARQAMQQIPTLMAKYQEAQKFLAGAAGQIRQKQDEIAALEQRRVEAEKKTKPAEQRLATLERQYQERKSTLDREIAEREKRLTDLRTELERFKSKITV